MVTHDVGLKNFASKIVRMIDGKINRIEENSQELRVHQIEALKAKVAEHQQAILS